MTAGPIEPLAARLAQHQGSTLVGRQAERERLTGWLTPGFGPAVVFVHGSAGIGKSALVETVVVAAGGPAAVLDARDLAPTPTGVLAALGATLTPPRPLTPDEVTARLAEERLQVVVIDGFERLAPIEDWLRRELVPSVPSDTTLVVVGRRRPDALWRSPPWRRLIGELELAGLSHAEILELARTFGLPDDLAVEVARFSRGHPLAAELAAAAFLRHPQLHLSDGAPADVIEDLYDLLLDDLPVEHRRLVESISVLRRVTRPVLHAVLDPADPPPEEAWRILRALAMVRTTPAGLELTSVAADVISSGLQARDPERAAELRRRAATSIVSGAGAPMSWAATADLIHLVQNPVLRHAFVPCGGLQHPVRPAGLDDLAALREITTRFDGAAAAALLDLWWQHHPSSLLVTRDADGEPRAYGFVLELDDLHPEVIAGDPVLHAIVADARDRPPDGRVLINRRSLGARLGEINSPDLATVVVDLTRYVEQRPDLCRIYAVIGDWATAAGPVRLMGYARCGEPVDVGGRPFQVIALDLGPDGVDGWVADHVLPDVPRRTVAPATAQRAGSEPVPAIREEPVPPIATLSNREREVLTALSEGLTNRELADRLFISERTANRHLSNIFVKLGVRNRTAAARMALEAGLGG